MHRHLGLPFRQPSRYNEVMKRFLSVSLWLFDSFASALSVPWDSLDWFQAQTVSPGQEIVLGGATEWVFRVALPAEPRTQTGHLKIQTENGAVTCGAFRWVPSTSKAELSERKTPETLETPATIAWEGVSPEWRKTADPLQMFMVSSDGARANQRGSWNLSDTLAAYGRISLEVSEPDAFDSASLLVVTPPLSAPNAPESGAFSPILLGDGSLLSLRRPTFRGIAV